jgi:predicted nucleotidyltransferase
MNFRNIVRLKIIANGLAELRQKVVFIGGAVAELYCGDPARNEAQPTDDINVVVEVLTRGAFAELEEKLRLIGFQTHGESLVICRYKYHDIIVDIMPTDAAILGFTNQWHREGI